VNIITMKISEAFKRTSVLSVVFVMAFFSCQGSFEPSGDQIKVIVPYGLWVYAGTKADVNYYFSAGCFQLDKPGIAFKKSNIFIERTSGWCGTPPVTFYNITGRWAVVGDSTLKITCSDCVDSVRMMHIVSLSDTELRIFYYH
jgi:hypothetical protein